MRDPERSVNITDPVVVVPVSIPETPAEEKPYKTIFERVAKEAKRKPGITINPEFEAAVQEMEADLKAKKKAIPCIHLTQDCKEPRGEDCECSECEDYKELLKESEKSLKLDLEMEDSADPVELPGDIPESDGYIAPEWKFDRPAQTIENIIMEKARREVEKVQELKQVLRRSLDIGEMISPTIVMDYNCIVEKYSREVGA